MQLRLLQNKHFQRPHFNHVTACVKYTTPSTRQCSEYWGRDLKLSPLRIHIIKLICQCDIPLCLITRGKTFRWHKCKFITGIMNTHHDQWVPVTTAWRILRLRMEERPPICWVAADILNK